MLNKKFIKNLQKDYKEKVGERRQIISLSNIILHDSKRIIFALHREDIKDAQNKFEELEKILKKLEKKFGFTRLLEEGSYKAAAEEYIEAKTFYLVLNNKKIDKIKGIKIDHESYLGGICDLLGELVRRAINKASKGEVKEVESINNIINDIMSELIKFDFTGYLRTKYDQARGHLRKIEQINYEIKIRK